MKRIASEIDAEHEWQPRGREHRYRGGPPPKRIKAMQLNHEVRARRLRLPYDLIDLRDVYARFGGKCGICHEPVSLDAFTIDHIIPMSKGGAHLMENLQPAHGSCNTRKGAKLEYGSPKKS